MPGSAKGNGLLEGHLLELIVRTIQDALEPPGASRLRGACVTLLQASMVREVGYRIERRPARAMVVLPVPEGPVMSQLRPPQPRANTRWACLTA